MASKTKRHIFIPDTQIRPGVRTDHLLWLARFIADHRLPDHLQFAGDWWDMPSLSTWSKKGSLEAEGRRIQADRDAGYQAMEMFFEELQRLGTTIDSMAFTMGNHEHRLSRAVNEDPRLQGLIDIDTFYGLDDFGLEWAEFGAPMHFDGVTYCHLFDLNARGKSFGSRNGQTTALQQVQRVRGSSVAGHQQGYDFKPLDHPYAKPWEQKTFAVIAGSFYLHKEPYRGPTDGVEDRGVVVIDELNGWGRGVPRLITMDYLKEHHGS